MSSPAHAERLPRRLVLLMGAGCGVSAANLYYAQPLLHTIGNALHVSIGSAGLLVTTTQVGFAIGLVLVVPLGDLLERRRLITSMLGCAVVALLIACVAPSFTVLIAALALVGLTSVTAQILVPLASTLASEQERGRVLGTVMGGLLIGILLARTFSGLVCQLGGWRLVYALAAVVVLALAMVLRRELPQAPPHTDVHYTALLRSVARLIAEEPVLRWRMLYGALGMAQFSVLWTTIAFLLAGGAYGYGEATIGLFGLIGLAGALAAQGAGRFADRNRGQLAAVIFILATVGSWALLAWGKTSLAGLILGVALLDLGIQGLHVTNQGEIYRLRPAVRSRLTTAYMGAYFAGGATASAIAATTYASGGWSAVALLGAGLAVASLLVWIAEQYVHARARRRGRLRDALQALFATTAATAASPPAAGGAETDRVRDHKVVSPLPGEQDARG